MNRKMVSLVLILAMLFSTVVVSQAQPTPTSGPYGPSSGPYPSTPGSYPSGPGNYPSVPGSTPYPSGQGSTPYPGGDQSSGSGQSSGGHPLSGPASEQPMSAPEASAGGMATNLGQGQQLSMQEVASIGGDVSGGASGSVGEPGEAQVFRMVIGPQLKYWALYNGMWTMDPAAVYYNQMMNTLTYNDQGQQLWSYERYPNGYESWQNMGYRYPGYYNLWFQGDAGGWHQIAIWGSNSGWSNVLWIYVW